MAALAVDRSGKEMAVGCLCWCGRSLAVVLADGRVEKMSGGYTDGASCTRVGPTFKPNARQSLWLAGREPVAPLPSVAELLERGRAKARELRGEEAVSAGDVVSLFGSIGVVGSDGRCHFEDGTSESMERPEDFVLCNAEELATEELALALRIRKSLGLVVLESVEARPSGTMEVEAPALSGGGEDETEQRRRQSVAPTPAPVNETVESASALSRQVGGSHYKDQGLQPWQVIEANGLDFWEGNALKYLLRWRRKAGVEDLRKAIHYIEYLIEREERKC